MVSSATPIGQSTATAENQKILESHQTTPSVTPTGLFKVISIIMFQHTTMILIWNKPHYYPKRKIKQSVPLQNDKKKKKNRNQMTEGKKLWKKRKCCNQSCGGRAETFTAGNKHQGPKTKHISVDMSGNHIGGVETERWETQRAERRWCRRAAMR